MRKSISFLIISLLICFMSQAQVKVENLLTENRSNPTGMDILVPRFSWQLTTDKRNTMQTAYEIRISNDLSALLKSKKIVWTSGKVMSDSSVHITYKVPPPESRKRYNWQV